MARSAAGNDSGFFQQVGPGLLQDRSRPMAIRAQSGRVGPSSRSVVGLSSGGRGSSPVSPAEPFAVGLSDWPAHDDPVPVPGRKLASRATPPSPAGSTVVSPGITDTVNSGAIRSSTELPIPGAARSAGTFPSSPRPAPSPPTAPRRRPAPSPEMPFRPALLLVQVERQQRGRLASGRGWRRS